jgi:hypothetical protein
MVMNSDLTPKRAALLSAVLLLGLVACNKASEQRRPVAEFKSLYAAKMVGLQYSADELGRAASIQSVVARFGSPVRSDETPSFGVDRKVLYFRAKDEYGNPCLAILTFQAVCSNNSKTPDCYKLVEEISTTAETAPGASVAPRVESAPAPAPVPSAPPIPPPSAGPNRVELVAAAEHGEIATVRTLLAQGVNIESKEDGFTTLMMAAATNHADIVTLLLEKGAKINAKGPDGETALGGAVVEGYVDVVKLLIAKGADPNARMSASHRSWASESILTLAEKEQKHPVGQPPNPEIARLLRAAGARY